MIPTKRYEAGQYIIHEDDTDKTMYIIMEGKVRVEARDPTTGEMVSLAELGPKDFFGETALLLDQPRNASVKALTSVEVYPISSKEMLADYVEIHPQFALRMIMIMARRVDQMKEAYLKTHGYLQYAKQILASLSQKGE
ncbi:MAG: cyclic nucleotide-binding domain-containing protein [Brevinematales bacterium]|nr:cyclic nucleotide-binding domain-containing protein [Brevinematales bacterium]